MRFSAALSTEPNTSRAIDEVCQQTVRALDAGCDLAVMFVSPHHQANFAELAARIQVETRAKIVLGCTGESIVGGTREIENEPALSLWLAELPGVRLVPMHLEFQQTTEGGTIGGWPRELPAQWGKDSALLLLGEPFSFPTDVLLERLNEDQPGIRVLGGMASGGYTSGENRLFLNGEILTEGAVGVWLDGPVRIQSVVSQGCRPIGSHFVITRAERNVVHELSGRPALACLQEVFAQLSPPEQELVRKGVHLGRVVNEYQESFQRGDFLIRNVVGGDNESGAIALGDYIRVGQTVQFHVRDTDSADHDLRELVTQSKHALGDRQAGGALLFTCNGRGTRLFSEADHDAAAISEIVGPLPLAGFFAQGEIGPIGEKNFVHGFTASLALFSEPEKST